MAKIYGVVAFVTEAAKNNGGEVFNILDDDTGGVNTFSVALSPNGQSNATHYGANFYEMDAALYNALKNMTVTQFKAYVDAEMLKKPGRTYSGSVTQFKNGLTITQGVDFHDFIAANNLKLVQSALKA